MSRPLNSTWTPTSARSSQWHFSPETGCPFWLNWARTAGRDPRREVRSFEDLLTCFPHFQDEWLRDEQPEVWVPAAFRGKPYNIFETGGTTGMPKQRIGWNDYKVDYEEFSGKVATSIFRAAAPG
jgi:phenylacetate-coenzyme A ligase PaaK-like adenylate-forming protein